MPGKTLVLDVWMETVGAGAAVLPSAGLAGGHHLGVRRAGWLGGRLGARWRRLETGRDGAGPLRMGPVDRRSHPHPAQAP